MSNTSRPTGDEVRLGQTASAASGHRTPLRYGVVLEERAVAWQASVLRHLVASDAARLALVVIAGQDTRREGREARTRAAGARARLATAAFDVYATRLSRARALRPVRVAAWPAGVAVTHAAVHGADPATAVLESNGIEAVRRAGIDLLLWLAPGIPTGRVHEACPLGVWSFRWTDPDGDPGRPLAVDELLDGRPVVRGALLRTPGPGGNEVVLREGWFACIPDSLARTRDRLLFGAASWPARAIRELAGDPLPATSAPPRTTPAAAPTVRGGRAVAATSATESGHASAQVTQRVSFAQLGRLLTLVARARARALWHHGLRHDDWNIGVVDAPVTSLLTADTLPSVDWAPTRRGRYAADPFGWRRGSSLEVLFEDYDHGTGRASIARRTWSRDDGWGPVEPALDIGTHLSYPFLADDEGRWLMLPESRAGGALVLYGSRDQSGPWEPRAVLDIDGGVADATLLRHGGRWWLFAALPDRLNPSTQLGLWFAEQPHGPWYEHPESPVVVDARAARPAGPCFTIDGELYRPAQDCSTGYGDRVTLRRITRLTTERFAEETVGVIRPTQHGPFPYGLHTVTGVGSVTLVDGKRRVWQTGALVRILRGRLRG